MDVTSKYSRLKANQSRIIDCYCEVCPNNLPTSILPCIKRRFPDTYRVKEVLEFVPKFTFPAGKHEVQAVTYFSFVLTNIESKLAFGFCRTKPDSDLCFVILSPLPWHGTFYKILNQIAVIHYDEQTKSNAKQTSELLNFLKALYQLKVPINRDATQIELTYETTSAIKKTVSYDIPDTDSLSSIPQSINLTEYYNAIDLDNMIKIFASALNERHFIVVSKKLDRLTACVQAINTLLYPLYWQHIFIPILPNDLLAYLQAPMPFLIGVLDKTYETLKKDDLGDAVILNVDKNTIETSFNDVKSLPPGVVNSIKSDLKEPVPLGITVSRAFLRALVMIIGGYREAIEFKDGRCITFNNEQFVHTRPSTYEPFLRKVLQLQMFRQFIESRLDMLKSGQGFIDDFELEVDFYNEKYASKSSKRIDLKYQDWLQSMKRKGNVFVKSINPSFKLVYKGIKEKSQQAYKDARDKIEKSASAQQATKFLYSRMD